MMNIVSEETVAGKYAKITKLLMEKGMTITTMESCTAGLIASLLTDTEGSSAVIKGAFVTYSNEAKLLQGVPGEVIARHGIYSQETAKAMASACRRTYHADIGIGVTGSFGNIDPANKDSVPGQAYFAIESAEGVWSWSCTIPPQPSRRAYKYYLADRIADQTERIL